MLWEKESQELQLDFGWKQLQKETAGYKIIPLKEFFICENSGVSFVRLSMVLKVELQLRGRASSGLPLQWNRETSTKGKIGLPKLSPLQAIYYLEGLGSLGLWLSLRLELWLGLQ